MKIRFLHILKIGAGIVGIGLAYVIFIKIVGRGIPCIFNVITGLRCPGCGITRMCMALWQLDFRSAFHYHPVVMCLLPFWMIALLIYLVQYIGKGKTRQTKLQSLILYASVAILVVYGIVRNI
jgi:hypothetical protein